MSLKSKNELLEVVRPRYLKASKSEKQKILDEFTAATGYHRKHAIRVLKNKVDAQNRLRGKGRSYRRLYQGEVVQALVQIWEIYGRICSKRLQPFLAEAIRVLERTFGWLGRYRRLARDYEHQTLSSESMVYIASIHRMLRLLSCET